MSERTSIAIFIADALAWSREPNEKLAIRLLRSHYSGVAHDIAAAYATIAAHDGNLLDTIGHERLALPADDRDALLAFARGLERFRAAATLGDDALAQLVRQTFGLPDSTVAYVGPAATGEFELAPAADAEPALGVKVPQRHFSASSLNAFVECRRKWFYRYICSSIEDKSSLASLYGTSFHTALEWFHEEFGHPTQAEETRMRARIPGYVERAFEQYRPEFGTPVEFTLHLRRAQRTAQRYVTWLIERSKRTPFTVVGRELAAELQVEGFDFIGYIDRVDRFDTGNVCVLDYKTGSIAGSAAEYRDKVRSFREFQLPFYYWAREAAGDRVTSLALIPLKDALLDVRPIELEIVALARDDVRRNGDAYGTLAILDLERARAKMAELCREITSNTIAHYGVTTDPSVCRYCAYALACNDRPAPEENRFGR
jgi:RecB family exonuclease